MAQRPPWPDPDQVIREWQACLEFLQDQRVTGAVHRQLGRHPGPRAEAFELFDAIGAADKRLHAQPGEHGDVPEEEFAAAEEFFARYLGRGNG